MWVGTALQVEAGHAGVYPYQRADPSAVIGAADVAKSGIMAVELFGDAMEIAWITGKASSPCCSANTSRVGPAMS